MSDGWLNTGGVALSTDDELDNELLEDADYPDLDPARYADEPDTDAGVIVRAAAFVICAGGSLDGARRFASRADAAEAERRGCAVPGCWGRHTLVWRDEDGQLRAAAGANDNRRIRFTSTTTYVPGDLLTVDELDRLADAESEAFQKTRRRSATRKHGPFTVGPATLTGESALTANVTTTVTVIGALGSGSLSATAHRRRRKKGTGGICWCHIADSWAVTVYRPTGNQWRQYAKTYDQAVVLVADMLAQVRGANESAAAAAARRKPKKRGNGTGSVYFRSAISTSPGYWVAAVSSRSGGKRTSRARYCRSEPAAYAALAELQGEADQRLMEQGIEQLRSHFNA